MRGTPPERRRPPADDAGFSLVELVVTMVVIGSVLLTLALLQTRALVSTTEAKQRQQATAIGNQVLEQLRSLPYDALAKGMNPAALSGDPNIVGGRFRPAANPAINEVPVATSTGVTNLPPLAGTGGTNLSSVADSATSSVTFSARAYTTRAAASTVDSPLWLSVVVTWSSSVTSGETRSAIFRSKAFAPTGCLSTTNRPFSGPCQAYLYGNAAVEGGQLSVSNPVSGSPVLDGATATSAALSLPDAGSGVASEQSNSVQGRIVTSGAQTSVGDVVTSAGAQEDSTLAGDDVGTSAAPLTDTTDLSQSSSPLVLDGTSATLTLTPSSSDSLRSSSTAEAAGTTCSDLAGTAMSGQPCASSTALQGGVASAVVDLEALGGRDLPAFDLGRVQAPTTTSAAWVGRYVAAAGTTRCLVLTGPGCVAAGARRALGTTVVGGLPAGSAGDTVPALVDGLVKVTGYTATAVVESGPSSTSVAASLSRSGTVRYWNGTGYTDVTLGTSTSTTVTLGTAAGTYLTGSATPLSVAVTGTLTVKPGSTTATTASAACTTACTKEAAMPSVSVVLSYVVSSGGAPVLSFDVSADLGESIASTSYQAAPSG